MSIRYINVSYLGKVWEVDNFQDFACQVQSYYKDDFVTGWAVGLNEADYTASLRVVDKMKVFVFKGPSAIGKSYLASKFVEGFKVYETDCSDELPSNMSDYDVVVLGNKYEFPELVELLSTTRDVVIVNFS